MVAVPPLQPESLVKEPPMPAAYCPALARLNLLVL